MRVPCRQAKAAVLEAAAKDLQERVRLLEAERDKQRAELEEPSRTVSQLGLQRPAIALAGSRTEVSGMKAAQPPLETASGWCNAMCSLIASGLESSGSFAS